MPDPSTPELPGELFENPVWTALDSVHRGIALGEGDALRYPADVTPFAGVREVTPATLRALRELLAPGDEVWLCGAAEEQIAAASLVLVQVVECHQMVFPGRLALPEPDPRIVPLTLADVPAMVALTQVAFPGFFRPRGPVLGAYFGIRKSAAEPELIALGGERFAWPGYVEISAICTHPAHRGQQLAQGIICHLIRQQRAAGVVSMLHVAADNQRAIDVYLHLGFVNRRTITLRRVRRSAE